MRSWAAATLVFSTSAAVLVLEILAGRLLAPYVGESLETYTGVIGTILAGIATGAAVGGRIADRRDPKPLLGPTLVVGGLLAWLALPVIDLLGPGVGPDPAGIVVLTSFGFFLPAAVLTAVSPMAAKLRLGDLGETGTVVGGLSAAGTAGALFGTFVTGFVLVAAIPTRPIVLGVGAALVVTGVVLWIRLASARADRGAIALVLLAAVSAGGWAISTDGPCEHETQYFCARIEIDPDRPSGRVLWLDTARHSYVDLEDPRHLEFRYTRLFADVTEATMPPGPIEALHIGGGGFTFPRFLAATRPETESTVLEIDEALVRLAEDELGLERGPDLRARTGDARLTIADEPDDGYDLVVGDAFGGLSVPWHLTTEEMLEEIERVLVPRGVYVVNLIDGGSEGFARAEARTFREVFDHVTVIAPPSSIAGDGPPRNFVLVGSNQAIPPLQVASGDGRVLDADAFGDFVDGAHLLTDDFAPVDQLATLR